MPTCRLDELGMPSFSEKKRYARNTEQKIKFGLLLNVAAKCHHAAQSN